MNDSFQKNSSIQRYYTISTKVNKTATAVVSVISDSHITASGIIVNSKMIISCNSTIRNLKLFSLTTLIRMVTAKAMVETEHATAIQPAI